MTIRVLTLAVAVLATGCGSSNDYDDSALQEDPGSSLVDQGSTGTVQEPYVDVITMDNHVDLLRNVFAIYSGKLWADEVLLEPDSENPLVSLAPYYTGGTGDLLSTRVDIVCENGGTVSIIPHTDGSPSDALTSWDFEFENCQEKNAIRDGQLKREIYESVKFMSTGYSNTSQSRKIQFSGDLYYSTFGTERDEGLGQLKTSNTYFTYSNNVDNLIVSVSNANFDAGINLGVSGGFRVRANWTNEHEITVRTIEDLRLEGRAGSVFNRGSLEVRYGDENILILDTDTAEVDTVEIKITSGGTTETVIKPWSLWSDSFRFYSVSGF